MATSPVEAVREELTGLERRVAHGYRTCVESRLVTLERRLDAAMTARERAVESEATTARLTRRRLDDIEARIESGFRAQVTAELDEMEHRIDRAHREVEAGARLEASESVARRLRVVVVVLLTLLALAGGALAVFLLF